MNFNHVTLIGRLVRAIEMRRTNAGKSVVSCSMAVNRPTKNQDGTSQVDFFDVVLWDRTAEMAAQYLQQGQEFLVDGRLQVSRYTTQSGENRQRVEVVGSHITFGALPRSAQRNEVAEAPAEAPAEALAPAVAGSRMHVGNDGAWGDIPF